MIKTTKEMIVSAIFAAVISAFSVMSIPVGPVSITMGVFGILLASLILPTAQSILSVLIFIMCGAVGIPVFSGMRGGIGVLLGETGGYIWSYLFMTAFCSLACRKTKKMQTKFFACVFSVIICYVFGTLQFSFLTGRSIEESFVLCVIPFIPFDIAKIIFACVLSEKIKKRISIGQFS